MINSRLGIFMTEGEHWRRHSAFVSATLHRFKESGFLERVVLDELKKLIQRLDTHSGQPQYDVMGEVMKAYADIIGRVLFGRVFTSTTELGILKEQVNCFFAVQGDVAPVLKSPSLLRPILCRLPRHSSAWQKFLDATSGVVSFIDVAIEERPSDEDCYAAAYMARQGQEEGSSFTHEQLRAECMDMLMPCLDDPIIQFGWGLAWALNSVWVMGWLEEEMQEVARSQGWSPDYLVCMADRTHLPRLWAFLEVGWDGGRVDGGRRERGYSFNLTLTPTHRRPTASPTPPCRTTSTAAPGTWCWMVTAYRRALGSCHRSPPPSTIQW